MSCFLLFEVIHGLSDGHHFELKILSEEMFHYSKYMTYISFFESMICLFGFRWYRHEYANRYSNDIYKSSK